MSTMFCAGGFILKEDKFLFGKRADTKSWYAGVWDIFGGHALPGESPPDTLKRELNEELHIVPIRYELVVIADIFEEVLASSIKYHIYFVSEWSGTPVNRSEEHSELRWFHRHELNTIQLASEKYLILIDAWIKKNQADKR